MILLIYIAKTASFKKWTSKKKNQEIKVLFFFFLLFLFSHQGYNIVW